MYNDFEKVLISKDKLENKVKELATQISSDYQGKTPLFICILKGSVFFTADLLKNLTIPAQLECMAVSSYGAGSTSSGDVKIVKDLTVDINGKDVIILEDIIDSGNTLACLKKLLLKRNPASLKICTLLDKPERRRAEIEVDYTGFEIPDEFVVGYGLDFNEYYRNLPYVGILKPEAYQ